MSINRDCPSCATGKHERHNPNHGIIEGCIGGTHCGCAGDCAERYTAAVQKMAESFNNLPNWKTPTGKEHS